MLLFQKGYRLNHNKEIIKDIDIEIFQIHEAIAFFQKPVCIKTRLKTVSQ